MSQIIFNKSYRHYPTNIDEFLDTIISENKLNSLIIVLPTQKLVRFTKQKLIKKYYNRYRIPLSNVKIFNLKNFIENCYDRIFNDRHLLQISDSYKMLLFEEAIENANLSFYSTNKRKLSSTLIERLANVVYGLKEDGITVKDMQKELEDFQPNEFDYFDEKRVQDILTIYQEYEKLLENKYLDDISLIYKVIEKFNENANHDYIKKIYPEIESIFLFGFTEFKVPEYEFLSYFSETDISFSIVVDYSILNGPIFGNLESTIEHFLAKGFRLTENEDKYKDIKEKDLIENNYDFIKFDLNREVYLRKWLFNHYYDLKSTEFNDLITIIGCQDKQNEVETIAKLVKYYILVKGFSPAEICIVSRKAESYSELFREIFSLYQIPYNVSDRFSLNRSPVIISIISLLNVIIYGYRFDDLTKALNNRYITIDDIDKDNLLNVAKNLKILGGRERGGLINWKDLLMDRIESLKKLLSEHDNLIEDNLERKTLENDLKNYEKAYLDFDKIVDFLPNIKNQLTFEEFIELIQKDIIQKFNIKEKIEKSLENYLLNRNSRENFDDLIILEGIEKEARAIKSFENLINEISRVHTLRYGQRNYNNDILLDKIKTAIEATKYQVKERQNFGVNITSIEQTRGIPYKLMILCGANDGEFPLKYKTDTIVGKELKDSFRKHLKSERLLFYQFLTNNPTALNDGTKEIFITYSQFESDEYLVKSSFVDALLKITSLNEAGKVLTVNLLKKNKNLYEKQYPWFYSIANLNDLFEQYPKFDIKETTKNYINEEILQYFLMKLINLDSVETLSDIEQIKKKIDSYISKPLSISRIELFAKCPFKFLVDTIFNIKEEELEIDFGITPLTKGSILHKVLKTFYEKQKLEILDENNYEYRIDPIRNDLDIIIPVKLIPNKKEIYLEQLKNIYLSLEETIKNDHPYFKIDSEQILGYDDSPGILEYWLDAELSRIENGWITSPVLFELGFGLNKFEVIKPIEIDGNEFKGKIDRIELYKENNDYYFLVADYKLNYKDELTNKMIKDNISFQMPVYIAATKEILKKYYNIDATPIGGIYYFLNITKKSSKIIKFQHVLMEKNSILPLPNIDKKELLEENESKEIIKTSFYSINSIKKKIIDLEFYASPYNDKFCEFCNYYDICQIRKRELS